MSKVNHFACPFPYPQARRWRWRHCVAPLFWWCVSGICGILAWAGPAPTNIVIFTSNTTLGTNDLQYDGRDLIVEKCTLTISGAHSFASLRLTNAAVLTHPAWNTNTNPRPILQITGAMEIDSSSRIDLTGRGYSGTSGKGNGPGGGGGIQADGNGGGAGGAYGGHAGQGESTHRPGEAYGSMMEPAEYGSAGGAGYAGPGGNGGGALQLIVGGRLVIDGVVNADGVAGLSNYYGSSGGGAGGSVWIRADTLAGSGRISANGGNGPGASQEDGGGGSGGRLSIQAQSDEYTGLVTARGGAGYAAGGAGTIFSKVGANPRGTVRIDNADQTSGLTPWNLTNQFDEVLISGNARLELLSGPTYSFGGLLRIATNSSVLCRSTNHAAVVEGKGRAQVWRWRRIACKLMLGD